ncbi:hypothetical protein PV10_08891, partial [Exophiala mesophila]
ACRGERQPAGSFEPARARYLHRVIVLRDFQVFKTACGTITQMTSDVIEDAKVIEVCSYRAHFSIYPFDIPETVILPGGEGRFKPTRVCDHQESGRRKITIVPCADSSKRIQRITM